MQQFSRSRHEPRPLTLFLRMLSERAGNDAEFTRRVLAGLRAYQDAERRPRPQPAPEIARIGRAGVLDYGVGAGRPVLFVPSLINPPYVLDLAEDNSLLRWLGGTGVRPLLIDWGEPGESGRRLSVAGHVEQLLVPLIEQLGPDVVLAGYCLGGTMAIAAAVKTPVAGLVMIASPWDFGGYPGEMRTALGRLWEAGRPTAEALGLFPMEMLQSAFWQLDPGRTLEKFAAFGEMAGAEAEAFVILEDWANEGPPLPLPAARELICDMFGRNLPGAAQWQVGERIIDPAALDCPMLNIISMSDRIVPAATACRMGDRLVLDQGHVGMVIGRQARAALWQPLAAWLSQVRHN